MATLNMRRAACKNQQGKEVFEWLARLNSIYAQFRVAGAEIPDLEKKHRAMGLISDVPVWGSMAHLLGIPAVSYTEWRQTILRKVEEFEQNGRCQGKNWLIDELYGHGVRHPQDPENALPATTLHQTF